MAFTTKEKVKYHIWGSTTSTQYDSIFDQLIAQVDDVITKRTGVATDSSAVVTVTNEIVRGLGGLEIKTNKHPITELTKIEARDSNNDWDEYTDEVITTVEFDDDTIYTEYVVAPIGKRQIRLNYKAGYKTTDVPDDLVLCATLMVVQLFNQRDIVGLQSQSVLGMNLQISQEDNNFIEKILTQYTPIYAL